MTRPTVTCACCGGQTNMQQEIALKPYCPQCFQSEVSQLWHKRHAARKRVKEQNDEIRRLQAEVERLTEIVELKDRLLVAYRTCRPPSCKTLNRLRELQEADDA